MPASYAANIKVLSLFRLPQSYSRLSLILALFLNRPKPFNRDTRGVLSFLALMGIRKERIYGLYICLIVLHFHCFWSTFLFLDVPSCCPFPLTIYALTLQHYG